MNSELMMSRKISFVLSIQALTDGENKERATKVDPARCHYEFANLLSGTVVWEEGWNFTFSLIADKLFITQQHK